MKIGRICILFLSLAAAACGAAETATPVASATPGRPTSTPPPSATPATVPTTRSSPAAPSDPRPLLNYAGRYFSTAGSCTACHTNLRDDSGRDVSLDRSWRSTLLANAGRDPFFLASVRLEGAARPEAREQLETTCAACHMPMAYFTAVSQDQPATLLDGGFLDPDHELHNLAMDGVSCALCHQIRDTSLGLPDSYNGGYVIDSEIPQGDRVMFGPYSIDSDQAQVMQEVSGFTAAQGVHLSRSEICATCHTWYVGPFGSSGEAFPVQVTYFEWFYSSFRRTETCQDCHMPEAQGGVRIASTSPNPRSPFAEHSFPGANTYLLRILQAFAGELGAPASDAHFSATISASETNLARDTATVTIEEAQRSGSRLTIEVLVENQAGHKFPTGYPSRRAWLHLTVRDAAGQVVFESGAAGADGSIAGDDGEADLASFEPHYFAIVSPDQVQIYETILQGASGQITTSLAQAVSYMKDNRLLPVGFEKSAPYQDLMVRGRAREDSDFVDGADRIQYSIDVGTAVGPLTVEVELLYQSVGTRWIRGLQDASGPEIDQFLRFASTVPNLPSVVALATAEVP
jgi:mono/diheme cytochrome c family protein